MSPNAGLPAATTTANCEAVLDEIGRVVVGKRAALSLILTTVLGGGHVLIEDLPGLGKTLIARSFAAALGLEFTRVQFTPDLLPADLLGSTVYDMQSGRFEFRRGPIFTNLLLADEINRTPPKTQAALLESMAEGQVSIDGVTHKLPAPFIVLATDNPIEYEGTYPLPEAQPDRFAIPLELRYLSEQEEASMLRRRLDRGSAQPTVNQVVDAHDLIAMRDSVEQVTVHDDVLRYVVSLATATRQHPQVAVGASPRAELDLVQLARAKALLLGRDYVIPEDVKSLAVPTMAHRISLRPEMWVRRVHGSDVVEELLRRLPVPRAKGPRCGGTVGGAPGPGGQGADGVIEPRRSEVELDWRPSPLTRAVVTCAAAGLAVAVIGGFWQLIAFAAPLVGVLMSIGWQRGVPKVHVYGEPGSLRCFESEETRLSVWAVAETTDVTVALTVGAVDGMRLETVEPDSQQRRTVAATADKWGRYPIVARVNVVARGGLVLGTGVADAANVFVFPLAPPQSTAIPRTELLDRLGTHLTRHIGPGVEYADVRLYVPGDQLRTVNWPVSARRGHLHVTERLTDRAADVVVLIDGYPQPPGPATDATDRIVRGAVQVVQSALRSGDRAGIVALGGRHPRWLEADIGRRQFYRILDAVLTAGDFETTPGTLAPRAALPPGAIVIAFSTLLDTEFALALIDLRKRGHTVVAVDVLEGAPFEAGRDRLVARMWSLQRSFMYRDMGTIGVDVVSWHGDATLDQAVHLVPDHRRPLRRRAARI